MQNTTQHEVANVLTDTMVRAGFQVKNVTPYKAVYGIRDSSFGSTVLYGSQYDSIPELRISYNLVGVGNNVRVVADIEMITNPNSAFERVAPSSNDEQIRVIQETLNTLANAFRDRAAQVR